MEISGVVHEIGEVVVVTDTFKKRDLVLQYAENPEFVEYIKFEATQDRVNIFDKVSVGDSVEVGFNLRGRPWTGKDGVTQYFNSLVAWRVAKVDSTSPEYVEPNSGEGNDDDDGLPF